MTPAEILANIRYRSNDRTRPVVLSVSEVTSLLDDATCLRELCEGLPKCCYSNETGLACDRVATWQSPNSPHQKLGCDDHPPADYYQRWYRKELPTAAVTRRLGL